MERRTEITLLGDSILKGIQVDPKTRGYQVRNDIGIPELEAEFSLHVRNDAHFGATCVKGTKLLDRLLASGRPCQAVVMDFGGNDCDFRWRDIAAGPRRDPSAGRCRCRSSGSGTGGWSAACGRRGSSRF